MSGCEDLSPVEIGSSPETFQSTAENYGVVQGILVLSLPRKILAGDEIVIAFFPVETRAESIKDETDISKYIQVTYKV